MLQEILKILSSVYSAYYVKTILALVLYLFSGYTAYCRLYIFSE
jgi:hypothetical protein